MANPLGKPITIIPEKMINHSLATIGLDMITEFFTENIVIKIRKRDEINSYTSGPNIVDDTYKIPLKQVPKDIC